MYFVLTTKPMETKPLDSEYINQHVFLFEFNIQTCTNQNSVFLRKYFRIPVSHFVVVYHRDVYMAAQVSPRSPPFLLEFEEFLQFFTFNCIEKVSKVLK